MKKKILKTRCYRQKAKKESQQKIKQIIYPNVNESGELQFKVEFYTLINI